MRLEDCYKGLIVVGTPEASQEYGVTVEGVIGVIEDIDKYEFDDEDIDTILIKPAGIQSREDILQIVNQNPHFMGYGEVTDVEEFFYSGYWVNPKFFAPYQVKPEVTVSLSEYIM